MNTDEKTKKAGFFLSVFICVHPWLNLFVRSLPNFPACLSPYSELLMSTRNFCLAGKMD
jgi:hypothetical protein